MKNHIEEETVKIKKQPGKDMVILGNGSIVSTFAQRGLIDEHRIMVNPVIRGNGAPLFKDIKDKLSLKLSKARAFKSGNVLLSYAPAQ